MYTKNELLFPHYAISRLRDARGDAWRNLVDHVTRLPETHEDVLAFMLMMIRVNGCMPCETDSYRAMRGCIMCSLQTLRRFKDSDDDLIAEYRQAQADVHQHLRRPHAPSLLVDMVV